MLLQKTYLTGFHSWLQYKNMLSCILLLVCSWLGVLQVLTCCSEGVVLHRVKTTSFLKIHLFPVRLKRGFSQSLQATKLCLISWLQFFFFFSDVFNKSYLSPSPFSTSRVSGCIITRCLRSLIIVVIT